MILKKDRIQSNFLREQAKLAKNSKMTIELDKDFLSKSSNILQYYIQLLRKYESNSPNDNILELKIIKVINFYKKYNSLKMHNFLTKEFPPYNSECLLQSAPNPTDTPRFEKGLICTQFYTVDNGLSGIKSRKEREMQFLSKPDEDMNLECR